MEIHSQVRRAVEPNKLLTEFHPLIRQYTCDGNSFASSESGKTNKLLTEFHPLIRQYTENFEEAMNRNECGVKGSERNFETF